ncbi:LysR family transcriptional regulator [Epibacterium ulvae]|uniref:LysR substrate-binding domain-containing protein n=1 Tax=Epibacterium ulvae TaxID=1156985 RepID=UPI001BFCC457|nr:LysR substrate-binding domain-containing protein [Epibacterium ulvae]MBT8154163.1 LysR family transcriptional regulator [Epibacterium ulvae]
MISLPPLNGLRAFDAAGRRLSFRAAADELGVTQGAVAQHVRHLEAELGVTLFDRVPKGLALTSAGRSYHQQVAAAFSALRQATSELRPEPNKVVISVTPSFASKWLIPNLPDFAAQHPDIDLRIMATESVSSFHSDGIDLAIRQGTPPFGAMLNADLLFQQDMVAVVAPSLVQSCARPITANDLAALPKIHDAHDLWPAALAELGIIDQARRGLRLSQTALAVDAALSGQGIALVSRFLVADDIAAGTLLEVAKLPNSKTHDFYLLSPRSSHRNSAIMAVVAWLKDAAGP